jgi:uncharacterized membrane protein
MSSETDTTEVVPDQPADASTGDVDASTGDVSAGAVDADGGEGDLIDRAEAFLRRPNTMPFGVILLITLWWAWRFSQLVIIRQNRFGSVDFDSGIFGQAAWLAAHASQFDTVRGLPLYGHHATFGFYLFAPVYWLGFDGVTVMNVTQVLACAAVPLVVYWLARRLDLQPWIACLAGFVCLAHFSMSWIAQELFHPEVFAIAPILAAYGFAIRNQTKPYWLLILFAIIWKEDVALAVIGLGVVFVIQGKGEAGKAQRRLGLYTVAFAAIWFVLATQVLLPHFSPTGKAFYAEGFYGDLGNNFTSVAGSFVSHPSRAIRHLSNANLVGYLRNLWAPFGFVNLLAPVTLLIAIPQVLANLLSINNFTWSLRFHYIAIPLAASMLGFVLGLKSLRGNWRVFAAGVALAASLGTALSWGVGPYSTNYKSGYWPLSTPANDAQIKHALSLIPPNASVSASYHLVPHLTERKSIFSFPNPWQGRNWGINDGDQRNPKDIEWLIALKGDLGPEDQQLLNSIITGPDALKVVYQEGDVIVAKRDSG